jgi:hypothetical protein
MGICVQAGVSTLFRRIEAFGLGIMPNIWTRVAACAFCALGSELLFYFILIFFFPFLSWPSPLGIAYVSFHQGDN